MSVEVGKNAESIASCPEVVVQLCAVLVGDCRHCLHFENDPLEADEIGLILLLERFLFVDQAELGLLAEGDSTEFEFDS